MDLSKYLVGLVGVWTLEFAACVLLNRFAFHSAIASVRMTLAIGIVIWFGVWLHKRHFIFKRRSDIAYVWVSRIALVLAVLVCATNQPLFVSLMTGLLAVASVTLWMGIYEKGHRKTLPPVSSELAVSSRPIVSPTSKSFVVPSGDSE